MAWHGLVLQHGQTCPAMAKPMLLLLNKSKKKKSRNDFEAIRTFAILWVHHFRQLTHDRRLNILKQTHVGLLSRAAEKLPLGGEDLFGSEFLSELVTQVKTAAQVSRSLTSLATASKPPTQRSPPCVVDSQKVSRNSNRYKVFLYVKLFIIFFFFSLPLLSLLFTLLLNVADAKGHWKLKCFSRPFTFNDPPL